MPTNSTAASPQYLITELPTLGGDASRAEAINERGQIVGAAATVQHMNRFDQEVSHASLWQSSGQVQDLTSNLAGNVRTEALSLNERGDVLVNLLDEGRCILWTPGKGGHRFSLDLLTKEKYRFDYATGINNKGQIVGYQKKLIFNDGQGRSIAYAFVWQNNRAHVLSSGKAYSYANGINTNGDIVGKQDVTGDKPGAPVQAHAVLRRSGTKKFTDLGALAPAPCNSEATAINDHEQIVGFSYIGSVNAPIHAFLWQKGQMEDLGSLVLRDMAAKTLANTGSLATAINNEGQVVGYTTSEISGKNKGDSIALLWQNHHAYDLNDCVDSSSGWILLAAKDINNKGQIVGVGTHNGKTRGFVLTPK